MSSDELTEAADAVLAEYSGTSDDTILCGVEGTPTFLRKVWLAQQLLTPVLDQESVGSPAVLGSPSELTHSLRRAQRAARLLKSAILYDLDLTPLDPEEEDRVSGSLYRMHETESE